jgi:hypothetical protein
LIDTNGNLLSGAGRSYVVLSRAANPQASTASSLASRDTCASSCCKGHREFGFIDDGARDPEWDACIP